MFKNTILLTGVLFLLPTITYAAWWNPADWFSNTTDVQIVEADKEETENLENTIKELESENSSLQEEISALRQEVETQKAEVAKQKEATQIMAEAGEQSVEKISNLGDQQLQEAFDLADKIYEEYKYAYDGWASCQEGWNATLEFAEKAMNGTATQADLDRVIQHDARQKTMRQVSCSDDGLGTINCRFY